MVLIFLLVATTAPSPGKVVRQGDATDIQRTRAIIQKELFATERLVSCASVSKAKDIKKKKTPTYFCATGNPR